MHANSFPANTWQSFWMRQSWSAHTQLHQLRLHTTRCVRTVQAAPLIGSAPITFIGRGQSIQKMTPGSTPNGRLAETAEPDPLAKTEDAEMTVRS